MNKKSKILIIDDDTRICYILQKFLLNKNFNAKSVDGGAEAIELLKSEEFDLVLCDYVMPEVTGYDVVKSLNAIDKRPKIGIITGWGELIRNKEKEEMDVDFLINKPFDFLELETAINAALDIK
jgi:DNA-binding response OmpR family regulator